MPTKPNHVMRNPRQKTRSGHLKSNRFLAWSICGLWLLSTATGWLPPMLAFGYALLSTLTFLAYALDKSAARRGDTRIAERTLHLLALVGGWPGAFLAQEHLRHKTAKPMFLLVFWLCAGLNCLLLATLYVAQAQIREAPTESKPSQVAVSEPTR